MLSAEGSAPEEKGLGSLPMVFMDEAAESIAAHDRLVGFGLTDGKSALWDSKIEAAMRPLLVVVVDVRVEHRFEMAFVHDEDPVQTLSPDRPDKPLRIGIGPWSPPWSSNDLDALGLEDIVEHGTESLVPVMDEESQWRGPRLSSFRQVPGDLCAPAKIGRLCASAR